MAFPLDGELVTPARKDLIGDLAPRVGVDYFYQGDLDVGSTDTYDISQMTEMTATLKKNKDDTTAIATATRSGLTLNVTDETLGYFDFHWAGSDLTATYVGSCWWSLTGSDGTYEIPLLEGRVDLKAFA